MMRMMVLKLDFMFLGQKKRKENVGILEVLLGNGIVDGAA